MLMLERDGSLRRIDGPGRYGHTNGAALAVLARWVTASIPWRFNAIRRPSSPDQPFNNPRRPGEPILSNVDSM